jgi:hypothetical protein
MNKHRTIIYLLLAAVVTGAAGWGVYSYLSRSANVASQDIQSPATKDQIEAGQTIKDTSIKNGGQTGSDRPPAPSSQADGKDKVEVMITAANQTDTQLQVRTMISTVTTTGSCTLVLSQGDTRITRDANVQAASSTTTCMGFDIPISELGSGSWNLTVNFENDTLIGTSSRSVSLRR